MNIRNRSTVFFYVSIREGGRNDRNDRNRDRTPAIPKAANRRVRPKKAEPAPEMEAPQAEAVQETAPQTEE